VTIPVFKFLSRPFSKSEHVDRELSAHPSSHPKQRKVKQKEKGGNQLTAKAHGNQDKELAALVKLKRHR
jgi:hypothetical protein